MKKEDIFSAMQNIDEVYLNESEAAPSIKIKAGLGIGKTLAVAAALILVFGAALVLPKLANNDLIDPAGVVTVDELSPSIDMAIRAHFDLDGDDEITTEMLNSITSLKVYRQDVSVLSGTEYSLVRFEINGDNNFAAALPELMKPNYYEYVVGVLRDSGASTIIDGEDIGIDYNYQAYYSLYGAYSEDVYAFDKCPTDREVNLLYGILNAAGMLDAWKISGNEFDISSLKYFENLEEVEFVGVTPVGYSLSDSISVKITDASGFDTLEHPSYLDGVYPSPDGKYAIKIMVANFASNVVADSYTDVTYELFLIDNTGAVLATSNGPYGIENEVVFWSPDSKYAALEVIYDNEHTNVILFDTTNSTRRMLYDEEVLETFVKREFTYTSPDGTVWDIVHCNFDEWGEDSLKITLSLASAAGGHFTFGSYVYNIPTESATQLVYDLDLDEQWEQSFGPWEDDGIEIIEVDGIKIPVPAEYAANIFNGAFSSSPEDNILATLIYTPERDINGSGEICVIYRLTHEEYEYAHALYGDNSGADRILAKDEDYYYTMRVPADLQTGTAPNATKFTPMRRECVALIEAEFANVNNIGIITEPIEPDTTQTDDISIIIVDGIKIPIYNKHESYRDLGYATDGDYIFVLYNDPAFETADGANKYLFKLYKYTKHEYLYKFASDAEFGVPPAVNDFRSRASVVAIDGDYYYVMLIGDVPPTTTLYSEAVVEHFAEFNGFEKLNDENNVLEEIFTYDSEHKYFRYYPDGVESDYFYMIVLSQPVKDGEGGIWCVDRYFSMETSGTPLVDTAGRPTVGWQIHLPTLPFDSEYTDFDAYYKAQQQEYESGNPDYEVLGNPYSLIDYWCRATFGDSFNASNNIVQVDYLANGIYDY